MAQNNVFRGPARVVLVMDVPLASLLSLTLNHGAFDVHTAVHVADAPHAVHASRPHLLIVDLDFDGARGIDLIGRVWDGAKAIPCIAVTRRGAVGTKLEAFEHGADDIVTIPFSPDELVARVLAVMRRSYGEGISFIPVIKLGELEIDLANRRVHIGGNRLTLTSMEQALLYLLAANADRVLSREMILDTLWGADYVAESNVVDRHVRNLRRKLNDDWHDPAFIQTVAGEGYRFVRDHTPKLVDKTAKRNDRS